MISEPLPWLELNLLESGWCFLVILTAAVIRGYSGFGFSALTVAGLTLILPPAEVIPIAFLLEIGASIHMLPLVWKDIDWNRLRWLTMGMLIATPIGVYLLSILPEIPTRWLVLSLIFIASLLLLKGYQLKEASSGKALLSGRAYFLVGSTAPPQLADFRSYFFCSPPRPGPPSPGHLLLLIFFFPISQPWPFQD